MSKYEDELQETIASLISDIRHSILVDRPERAIAQTELLNKAMEALNPTNYKTQEEV